MFSATMWRCIGMPGMAGRIVAGVQSSSRDHVGRHRIDSSQNHAGIPLP